MPFPRASGTEKDESEIPGGRRWKPDEQIDERDERSAGGFDDEDVLREVIERRRHSFRELLAGLVDSRWRTLGRHEEGGVTFEHRLDRRQVGVDHAPQQVIADAHRRLGVLGPAHAHIVAPTPEPAIVVKGWRIATGSSLASRTR